MQDIALLNLRSSVTNSILIISNLQHPAMNNCLVSLEKLFNIIPVECAPLLFPRFLLKGISLFFRSPNWTFPGDGTKPSVSPNLFKSRKPERGIFFFTNVVSDAIVDSKIEVGTFDCTLVLKNKIESGSWCSNRSLFSGNSTLNVSMTFCF